MENNSQYSINNNLSQLNLEEKILIYKSEIKCFENKKTKETWDIKQITATDNKEILIKLYNYNQESLDLTMTTQAAHIKKKKDLGSEIGNFYYAYILFKSHSEEEFAIPYDLTEEKTRYMRKLSSTHLELEKETLEMQEKLANNMYQSYDDFLKDFIKNIEYVLDEGVDLELNAMNILKKMNILIPDVSKEKILHSNDEILKLINKQAIYFDRIIELASKKFYITKNNIKNRIGTMLSKLTLTQAIQKTTKESKKQRSLKKILEAINKETNILDNIAINKELANTLIYIIEEDIAERLSKLKLSTFSSMFLTNAFTMNDFFNTLNTVQKDTINESIEKTKNKTLEMIKSNQHTNDQVILIPSHFCFLKTLFNPDFTKQIVEITASSIALQSDDIQVNQGNIIIQNSNNNFTPVVIDTGHSFRKSKSYGVESANQNTLDISVSRNINYPMALIANMDEEMQVVFVKTYFKAQLEIMIQQGFIENVQNTNQFNQLLEEDLKNNTNIAMEKFNNAKEKLRQKYHIIICEELDSSKCYFNAMKAVTVGRLNTNDQDLIQTILSEVLELQQIPQNNNLSFASHQLESNFEEYLKSYKFDKKSPNMTEIIKKWPEKLPDNHKSELLNAININENNIFIPIARPNILNVPTNIAEEQKYDDIEEVPIHQNPQPNSNRTAVAQYPDFQEIQNEALHINQIPQYQAQVHHRRLAEPNQENQQRQPGVLYNPETTTEDTTCCYNNNSKCVTF